MPILIQIFMLIAITTHIVLPGFIKTVRKAGPKAQFIAIWATAILTLPMWWSFAASVPGKSLVMLAGVIVFAVLLLLSRLIRKDSHGSQGSV